MIWANSTNRNRRRAEELATFFGLADAQIKVPMRPYQLMSQVPPAWRDYAARLVEMLRSRLASNQSVSEWIAAALRDGISSDTSKPAIVRIWISPNGKIERLVFDDLAGDLADAIRVPLCNSDVGPPPAEMTQPLHISLSLAARRSQEQIH